MGGPASVYAINNYGNQRKYKNDPIKLTHESALVNT